MSVKNKIFTRDENGRKTSVTRRFAFVWFPSFSKETSILQRFGLQKEEDDDDVFGKPEDAKSALYDLHEKIEDDEVMKIALQLNGSSGVFANTRPLRVEFLVCKTVNMGFFLLEPVLLATMERPLTSTNFVRYL